MNLSQCFLRLSEIEEDGAERYRIFSEGTSEKLRAVAISFAQEEYKHRKMMIELSRQEEFKNIYLNDEVKEAIQIQLDYSAKNSNNVDRTSEKEFFKYSLQQEKNSIKTYEKIREMIEEDSNHYNQFESLIGEEKKHMIFILNKLYE